MSDPRAEEQSLTGMLPTGSFGSDPAEPSTGEGDDVRADRAEREGEPDQNAGLIEPGQD